MISLRTKRLLGLCLIAATVGLSLWIVTVPTDSLLAYVGTDNLYVFMFVIAFFGSITTFTSIPYPLILIGLVAAGMDPLWLGLVSASGVIMADTLTFTVAKRGRVLLSDKLQRSFATLASKLKRYPRLLSPGLVLYGTLAPLSNDFAVIPLAIMKYRYVQVVPALAVGNVFSNVGIAFLGVYAYGWIVGLM